MSLCHSLYVQEKLKSGFIPLKTLIRIKKVAHFLRVTLLAVKAETLLVNNFESQKLGNTFGVKFEMKIAPMCDQLHNLFPHFVLNVIRPQSQTPHPHMTDLPKHGTFLAI